jgi:hypothetical protein
MGSQALDRFTTNKALFEDLIEITNKVPAEHKPIMMRLLVVTLAAFWEAFHQDLCREWLSQRPNPPKPARNAIDNFHNPKSEKIRRLYAVVLQIPDITSSWWGNVLDKTGKSPAEHGQIIDNMMSVRHDTAHGEWKAQISASDCKEFLFTAVHLAIRTDDYAAALLTPTRPNE